MGYRRKILEAKKVQRKRKQHIDRTIGYNSQKRQCLKKTAYPTERRVLAKIAEIAQEGRTKLRYYQCPLCEMYHISHKKTGNQQFVS